MKLENCHWNRPSISYYSHDMMKCRDICFLSSLLACHYSQVGESSLQSGNLYSPFMKTCRSLFLGSNQSDQGQSFRGHIGGMVLWGYARSHEEMLKRPLQTDKSQPVLEMWADFTNVITYITFLHFIMLPVSHNWCLSSNHIKTLPI